MRVKICGITNIEDALCCAKYGADAIGFIFYNRSKRYIEVEDVKKITKLLPPFIERVGVFVENSAQEIDEICSYANLSLAQIHSNSIDTDRLKTKHLKVIRVESKEQLFSLKELNEVVLVDSYIKEYGGEGKSLDLRWFDDIDCSKLILAGGVEIGRLKEIKKQNFYGVDISSGVEIQKGKKCCKKVEEFILNAKRV